MDQAARRESGTGGGDDPAAGTDLATGRAAERELLGPGREFDLIRSFFTDSAPQRDDVPVGPGDDAAVVRGEGIVLTSDLSIEDTHFRRGWITPFDIGYRAAMAALSDLAGMAARPIGVLASLALSEADATSIASEIMHGVAAAVTSVGGVLLGGDLTSSPGPIILDIIGVGQSSEPVLRRGASPGDEVWVTGSLGAAAFAVHTLLRGESPPAEALDRYRQPIARIREAAWLAERNLARAMLDLSDGIGGDATHLATASGVAVILEAAQLPLHEALGAVDSAFALRLALSGGEDYELCIIAAPGSIQPHRDEFRRKLGCRLTRVGHVEVGEGVHLEEGGGERASLIDGGFQHFRSPT